MKNNAKNGVAIWVVMTMVILLGAGCNSAVASPTVEITTTTPTLLSLASATSAPPTFTFAPPSHSIATSTPLPPALTASPPTFTPTPLPCDTHAAAVELSASATTLQVGEVVTVSVTLRNQGCSQLGLPQYRLETTPPLLDPVRPEAVIHYLGLGPGQTDTAEFGPRAGKTGQVTLTASASFEVHLGYPGPAYWAGSSDAAPLVITVIPPAQPNPEPTPAANQLDLNGASIRAWAWSPDSQTLVLAGDKSVFLINRADPHNRVELQVAATEQVTAVAFSPDGQWLAVSLSSDALQVWNLPQQTLRFALDDDPRVDHFNTLAFSPDGQRLAAGGVNSRATSSSDGIVRIISLDTHHEITSFELYGWVTQVIFSPDGTLLGVTSSGTCGRGGGGTALFNAATGEPLPLNLPEAGNAISQSFSPDGRLLALGVQTGARCISDGGLVQLWDMVQEQPAGALPGLADGPTVTFSPDSALLAVSDGQALHVWSVATRQELLRLLPRFGTLGRVAFSPDGSVLAYQDAETIQLGELIP